MVDWMNKKSVDSIEWTDIQVLIDEKVSESFQLEFKSTIPSKQNDDPWLGGSSKISDYGRDAILKEICAFANTYGGTLILGVLENPETRQATEIIPIPRARELATKLSDIIRSTFDPPLAGCSVAAVTATGEDTTGLVIITVTASNLAPHAVSTLGQAFVRREASSVLMGMRDLHNAFWDARTSIERVSSIRSSADAFALELRDKNSQSFIRTFGPQAPGAEDSTVFRISSICQKSLNNIRLA